MRVVFLISLFFLHVSLISGQVLRCDISSPALILVNADNGHILFEKNKEEISFPASITKVATALYILDKYEDRLDQKVIAKREALASITPQAKKQSHYRCPAYWLDTDGSHMGIKLGEEFTLKTLLTAMLVASANDAANVMAEYLEGSIPLFIEKMNQYLKEKGCQKTTFYNPHGLHYPEHKTTAQDMAVIARLAMKHPLFRQIVASTYFLCPRTNLSEERYLTQTNHLLRQGPYFYKKAIGIKTGSTSQAGKTLVAAAKNGERNLIAVVLGSSSTQERYADVTKIFDKAFSEKKLRKNLLPLGIQKMKIKVPGGKKNLRTYLKEPLYYDFFPSELQEVKGRIKWSLPKLPILKDQQVGSALALDHQGKVLSQISVYALEDVQPTFFYQCKEFFFLKKKRFLQSAFFLGGALVLLFLLRRRKRRQKNYV